MKFKKLAPKKNAAQAMVEFAIVLPILLLLLYGLLEVGRLLFMYSTIVNASRQASRYGSATGLGVGSAVPRYQDCAGIRLAADKADFLRSFDHTGLDVVITYDDGEGVAVTSFDGICDGSVDTNVKPSTSNKTRIKVQVTGHFNPLVRLVPLRQRNIVSQSARTIIMGVPITVASGGGSTAKATTTNITTSPNPSQPGQPVTAAVTVTSSGGTPAGTVEVKLPDGTLLCAITLDPSGAGTCNGLVFNSTTFVHAFFIPQDSAAYAPSQKTDYQHQVGKSKTVTMILDTPDPSVVGGSVLISVAVMNEYPGPTPTGTVTISGCGTLTLNAGGTAFCNVTFNAAGNSIITASYSGDSTHETSNASQPHEVLTGTATPSPMPTATTPPTATIPPTATPVTPSPTNTPTNVPDCDDISASFTGVSNPIKFSKKTMFLVIPNPYPYPITISSIFVRWNYNGGSGSGDLYLESAKTTSTEFWTGSISRDNFTIDSFLQPVIIPPGGTTLTFTFDKTYMNQLGEELQLNFSTPGCQGYPVHVTNH